MLVSKRRLTALYAKKTDEQIGKLFGVSGRTIGEWRRRHSIATKPKVCKYTLDCDFFAVINTEEKAYALGLLSADGSIARSGKQVTIALQQRDVQILIDLRRAMGSSAVVFDKAAGGFPGSTLRKGITFNSKELVADLAKYGVSPGKSHNLKYPNIPRHLERHYARGLLDGDGHIRAVPKRLFYFLGTSALIEGLRLAIASHTGILLKKKKSVGCYRISGYGGSAEVIRWMYQDATIFLKRKHRVYLDHWS